MRRPDERDEQGRGLPISLKKANCNFQFPFDKRQYNKVGKKKKKQKYKQGRMEQGGAVWWHRLR